MTMVSYWYSEVHIKVQLGQFGVWCYLEESPVMSSPEFLVPLLCCFP